MEDARAEQFGVDTAGAHRTLVAFRLSGDADGAFQRTAETASQGRAGIFRLGIGIVETDGKGQASEGESVHGGGAL